MTDPREVNARDAPRAAANRPAPRSAPPQSAPPAGTVLVVDDDVSVRLVTARGLRKCGYACEVAENGAQALNRIDGGPPVDVVVTDLKMPVMDGDALCAALLARPDRPGLIVLTAVLEPDLHADLTARGVDRIFFKPASYREIGRAVDDLVAARRGARP